MKWEISCSVWFLNIFNPFNLFNLWYAIYLAGLNTIAVEAKRKNEFKINYLLKLEILKKNEKNKIEKKQQDIQYSFLKKF